MDTYEKKEIEKKKKIEETEEVIIIGKDRKEEIEFSSGERGVTVGSQEKKEKDGIQIKGRWEKIARKEEDAPILERDILTLKSSSMAKAVDDPLEKQKSDDSDVESVQFELVEPRTERRKIYTQEPEEDVEKIVLREFQTMTALSLGELGLEWLNQMEFTGERSAFLPELCVKGRIDVMKEILKVMIEKMEQMEKIGDPVHLRERNDELTRKLEEGQMKYERQRVENSKSRRTIGDLRIEVRRLKEEIAILQLQKEDEKASKEAILKTDIAEPAAPVPTRVEYAEVLESRKPAQSEKEDTCKIVETTEDRPSTSRSPESKEDVWIGVMSKREMKKRAYFKKLAERFKKLDESLKEKGMSQQSSISVAESGIGSKWKRKLDTFVSPSSAGASGTKRRSMQTAVISIKGRAEGISSWEALKKVREQISLQEMDMQSSFIESSAGGGVLIAIPGGNREEKADKLAEKIREVLQDEAEVSRFRR